MSTQPVGPSVPSRNEEARGLASQKKKKKKKARELMA